MFAVETVEDLWNHIAYVLAYAPNDFPKEDFLKDEDQQDLDSAFYLLKSGVFVAYPEDSYAIKRDQLIDTLTKSYTEYKLGDPIKAGHLLNDFQNKIFSSD